jgi:Domain of unknown function (DUF3943)
MVIGKIAFEFPMHMTLSSIVLRFLTALLVSIILVKSGNAQELPFLNRTKIGQEALQRLVRQQVNPPPMQEGAVPLTEVQKDKYTSLKEKTKYVVMTQSALLGMLIMLPESLSKWDKSEINRIGPLKHWEKHTFHAPVIDHDRIWVNASHAFLAGNGYHMMCRNLGYSPLECLGYSAVMSTIHEMALETFAEYPSIQDLIVTPLGGLAFGEGSYQIQFLIRANDGKVLGSKILGRVVLVLINPLNEVVNTIETLFGGTIKKHQLHMQIGYGNLPTSEHSVNNSTIMSIQLKGRF